VERIQRAVRVAASGGVEVRVRLEPESLGEVRVAVRWDGGAVSARLEVGSPAAREALESHLPALRKSLQEQGIPIQQMDVGIRRDLGGGGREREPWRPAPGQESSRLDHPVERGEVHATEGTRSGVLDIRI
jgi:flagellar hook-length control protein FliK